MEDAGKKRSFCAVTTLLGIYVFMCRLVCLCVVGLVSFLLFRFTNKHVATEWPRLYNIIG